MQNEYISNLTATTWWSKNTKFFLIKYFRCVRFVTIRDFWHLLRSTGRLLLEISQLVVCPVSLWLIFADTTTVSWKIKGCGERYNCRWKWKWFFFIKKVSRIVLVVVVLVFLYPIELNDLILYLLSLKHWQSSIRVVADMLLSNLSSIRRPCSRLDSFCI